MNEEFKRLIVDPLEEQAKTIGEDLSNYRICSQCLLYTPRASYSEHMREHGFETLYIEPRR